MGKKDKNRIFGIQLFAKYWLCVHLSWNFSILFVFFRGIMYGSFKTFALPARLGC